LNKFAITLVAIVALATGLFFGTRQSAPDLSELSGFSFPEPEALTEVALVDHNSEPFSETNFKDQWTFIYVGYTFCPDYCPATLTTLDQTHKLLSEEGDPQVSTMLLSVDPDRDTPEHLKDYVKFFNEDFTGVTGTPEEIKKFANQISAVYSVPENREDPNYLVDHSSTVVLINPDASVQAVFTAPQTADSLAKDFRLLAAHYDTR